MTNAKVLRFGALEELHQIFSPKEIAAKVEALGEKLTSFYGEDPVICIGVLRGAVIFFSDLIRAIKIPHLEIDFLRLASYGQSSSSSGEVILKQPLSTDLSGKHVLIVEDIIDSGRSMQTLLANIDVSQALSLRVVTLIDKKERREVEVKIDEACFELDSGFVVGYGLDYAERYRHLPGLYELKFLQN
ncbi:MAG: hypoxanthine phosphoribosyltransferase [Desulfovibrionaceae bacterium]|nr:hypoxanthine phosphoribosyltransferase [Desulfovibrionaceae bacterium]